jgi:hypothetical protein
MGVTEHNTCNYEMNVGTIGGRTHPWVVPLKTSPFKFIKPIQCFKII